MYALAQLGSQQKGCYYKIVQMQIQGILDRVGIGRTHIWMIFALSLVEIVNGYKMVMVSLISPYLKQQWNLEEEVKKIPSAFYCGIIAGSLLSGFLANISGRKTTLFVGQIVHCLSSLLMVYSNQFITFLATLVFAGMGFGITLIMANTLLSEQMPQKYRGKALLFISFIAIMGKFLAILATYYFGLKNWRVPEFYLSITGLILLVIIFFKVPQSFRVLLVKGQINEGQRIVSQLLKEQNKPQLTDEQKKSIKQFTTKNLMKPEKRNGFYEILSKGAIKTTLILSINWFVVNFMFYGQLFIMPFIFAKNESGGFSQFAQMILGELPSIVLTFNMIQRETFGRKNSLAIFFFSAALLNFSLIYFQSIFIISLSRLAMKSIVQILYPFTTESYSTPLRSSGLAFCAGIGRLGSILMPMIVYPLYQIDPYLVFVAFMGASMLGLYSSMSSNETLNHSLDHTDFDMQSENVSILSKEDQEGHQ